MLDKILKILLIIGISGYLLFVLFEIVAAIIIFH